MDDHWELVNRVIASAPFQRSRRLRELLLYICEQGLQNRPEELREYFAGHGCSIQKLMVEEATVFALTGREDKPPTPGPERTGPPGG